MNMRSWICATALLALAASTGVVAEDAPAAKTRVDLYGFAMLDMGYQSGQNHPDWYDVVRPTKLPSFEDEFGTDGRFFAGVRQSRLGVKSWTPTSVGELKTIFEFELFGTGVDAGQTTFRLRHAWGELGKFGAGQTWSPFMDPDVFPNSIEYWGPNGMVFFRNIQLRWTPVSGDNVFMVALERPGASGDGGVYSDRVELQDVQARFPLPDVSAQYRMNRGWGHFQAAGIVRWIEWDDLGAQPLDLSGDAVGWGVNLSTNLKFAEDTLRASVVYGEGIQNYMNDAPVDIGITNDINDIGEPLPILGIVLFFDYSWSKKLTSTIGYSMVDIDNSDGQAPSAFKKGQYALVNLLYYPVANVMLGPELQWGKRENNSDGFSSDDFRIQFSAKYSFGHTMGGK
ncbi:MAG TPA: DcaP family trimeric outer membrane transporter [Candidatus Polarisedimenticolaceae bacterium]